LGFAGLRRSGVGGYPKILQVIRKIIDIGKIHGNWHVADGAASLFSV
jgi:hypothetical protein